MMKCYMVFALLLSFGCDGSPPGGFEPQTIAESAAPFEDDVPQNDVPEAEIIRWVQEKSPERPDHASVSSQASCYCFPKGTDCYADAWSGGPRKAPDDLPACPVGEVCTGSAASYGKEFGAAQGQCAKVCYHEAARVPALVSQTELAEFLATDCADGEVCFLRDVDVGFEGTSKGRLGHCYREQRDISEDAPPPGQP